MTSRGARIKTSPAEPKSELTIIKKTSLSQSPRDKTILKEGSSAKVTQKQSLLDEPPTPQDFDRFIPWILFSLEEIIHVNIKRITRRLVKIIRQAEQSPTALEILPVCIMEGESFEEDYIQTFVDSYSPINRRFSVAADSEVIISAFYDSQENLSEIAFIDCPVLVPRQVFKAIQLCLPFHKQLTRLTFKGKRLDCGVLHEISKMLPVSNLTEVVLDHSYVAQGYYNILLEQASNLKYLSPSSCGIDDAECEKIARRIRRRKPGAENLLVLNLSINNITDAGAKALARSLRTNRRLLYLNLCNNSITNDGAAHILLPLAEFKLNFGEKIVLQESKYPSFKGATAFDRYLKDITNKSNVASTTTTSSKQHKTKKKYSKPFDMRVKSNRGLVDSMASDDGTVASDIFCSNTVYREGVWYSSGNLTLSSLNLAYNQLDFASILKICNVVTYQRRQEKGAQTGLLRVVIEGNNLPSKCDEYNYITECLDKAKRDSVPEPILQCTLKKPSPVGKSKRIRRAYKIGVIKLNQKMSLLSGTLEYNPAISSLDHNNPTPSEFDRFIPWVLSGVDELENVAVKRLTKENQKVLSVLHENTSKKLKKLSLRAFSRRTLSQVDVSRANAETYTKSGPNGKKNLRALSRRTLSQADVSRAKPGTKGSSGSVKTDSGSSTGKDENVITITAFYTSNGQLAEVAFIKSELPVPRIVLDAIRLCLPYHTQLTRITWNGNYLTGAIINEISKMLIDSFLTDVVLDNSSAPQENYYVLLDSANLKYLSLRSCGVSDEACEKIAEKIQRNQPGENLVALNLAVNLITDKGAKALGNALRTNRRLSFLNLCCNSITSDGAGHILLPLTKFPLNSDEIIEVKKTRFKLAKQKIDANKIYLSDITNTDVKADKKKRKTFKNENIHKRQDHTITEKTPDLMSEGVGVRLGANDDMFMSNTEVSSGVWFSLGNLALCSLNLAYNLLDVMAVSRIADVLSYQYREDRAPKSGLMRVVIEGNLLPKDSPKYDIIDKYMELALSVPTEMTENIGKGTKSAVSTFRSTHARPSPAPA